MLLQLNSAMVTCRGGFDFVFFSHLVFVLLVTVCVCVRLPATTYAKVKILSVSKMVLKLN